MWKAIDRETKLLISWLVSTGRDAASGIEFMQDLESRIVDRVQMSTDGLGSYLVAVEEAFGSDIDFAQLVKAYRADGTVYTDKRPIVGNPAEEMITTSHVERVNLTTRMSVRRYTRKTNAFSKKLANHRHMLAVYMVYYNWVRVHQTIKTTPAVAAGLTDRVYSLQDLAEMVDALTPKPSPRGPYRKTR